MNYDSKPICRVCLGICDQGFCTGIFDNYNETYVYEQINNITNINIKAKDGLPDKICMDCLEELQNAITFRKKCETSNNILLSTLDTSIGPKQEEEFPEVSVKEEPEESTECFEEAPSSPSELTLKLEIPEEQPQQQNHPEINIKPSRPSRAINLQVECHDCGNIFKSKFKLKVHWFKVHLKSQLTCKICGNSFKSFDNLKEHQLNRTKRCITMSQIRIEGEGKSRVFHCKQCVYSTNYIDTMTKHLAVHSGERMYSCSLCPATYRYINSFDGHMESKHGVIRKLIVCNVCGESMGPRKYSKHVRKHKVDSAKCNVCHKVFKSKSYMKVHMERHAGVKKYPCDKCDKTFITMNSLYNHLKTVHDSKRSIYNCDRCNFTHTNRKIMYKHKINHSKYHYVCIKCGKFFENATQLSCHEDRHNCKNYRCQDCDEAFFSRKQLLCHVNKMHDTVSILKLKNQTRKSK